MFENSILGKSEEFAKKEYAKHDELHQWSHVEGVLEIALKLAENYPEVDMEILKLAVFFHDINYESYETHVDKSAEVARRFLEINNFDESRIKRVVEVMLSHSSPHREKLGEAKTIEGKIIYDADKFIYAKLDGLLDNYYDRFYLDETRKLVDELR